MIKSILAGIMISVGCVSFLSVENKIAGTFLFSLGLYTIIILKFDLFTGKVGYLADNRTLSYLKYLAMVWLGNLIGTTASAAAVFCTRLKIDTSALVAVKQADSLPSLLILGIFCGMLMFIAVEGYKRTTNPLIVVLPVMAFILCGFEHCIADMFYFAFNFLGHPSLADLVSILSRLAVITLGNLLGGCLLCFASINIQKPKVEQDKG